MSQRIYSLSDLERLLKVKAHTIRTWESRYGLISPNRNESNVRYYTEEDKNLISSILLLKQSGCKLKNIASWSASEIAAKSSKIIDKEELIKQWINDILKYCLIYDKTSVEHIFVKVKETYSFDKMIHAVILPLFNQFNILWLTGAVHALHERFLGQLVYNELVFEVARLRKEITPRKTVLLFSPDSSEKSYLLKTIQYLLKKQECSVQYFGCNLAVPEVAPIVNDMPLDEIYILISEDIIPDSFHNWVKELSSNFKSLPVHIICHPSTRILPENTINMRVFNGIEEFRNYLQC